MSADRNGQPMHDTRTTVFAGRWLCLLSIDLAWLWVLMLLTHEIGHGGAALLTGGEIVAVDLRPGRPGHTLVEPNPDPHWVVWGGFLSGCLFPLAGWGLARLVHRQIVSDLRLLAGFCLLANGTYLAIGGSETLTDTGVLLSLGWPHPVLIAVGLLLAIPGYQLCRGELAARRLAVRAGRFGGRELLLRGVTLALWVAVQWLIAIQIMRWIA